MRVHTQCGISNSPISVAQNNDPYQRNHFVAHKELGNSSSNEHKVAPLYMNYIQMCAFRTFRRVMSLEMFM